MISLPSPHTPHPTRESRLGKAGPKAPPSPAKINTLKGLGVGVWGRG